MSDEFETVWIVLEVKDNSAINEIRRVYDNAQAANDYVADPENVGQFVVEREKVEGGWPFHGETEQ